MAVSIYKTEQVAAASIGLLERQIVLPGLFWRNAAGNFKGAKDDTKTIRVPALPGEARTVALRTEENAADGSQPNRKRVLDNLAETKVDVTLTTDIYKGVRVSDEQLTLDIENFGAQVLYPLMEAVAQGIEDLCATTIAGATYAAGHNLTYNEGDDLFKVILGARQVLNGRHVPQDRVILVGANAETDLLGSDRLSFVDNSGSDAALRRAEVGKLAGMPVITSLSIPADDIYVFHRTAFILSLMAPENARGAAWSVSTAHKGLAVRVVQDYDALYMQDRVIVDAFAGSNVVVDDLGAGNGTKGLVRAVKITKSES